MKTLPLISILVIMFATMLVFETMKLKKELRKVLKDYDKKVDQQKFLNHLKLQEKLDKLYQQEQQIKKTS